MGLPQLTGGPIRIYTRPQLTGHRGKLLSRTQRGTPVHAATFVRKREIVLETELLSAPRVLRLIVIHEIFHFVWTRLGNGARNEFAELLLREYQERARGELGESSNRKKELVTAHGQPRNSRLWRDYVCESFCDTAAWLYSGVKRDESFTLKKRWSDRRRVWLQATMREGCRC